MSPQEGGKTRGLRTLWFVGVCCFCLFAYLCKLSSLREEAFCLAAQTKVRSSPFFFALEGFLKYVFGNISPITLQGLRLPCHLFPKLFVDSHIS